MARSTSAAVAEDFKNTYKDDGYLLVVAIDFGTAFSGYAFSFQSSKTDIKLNRNWGNSVGMEAFKTPTCILFNPEEEAIAFGYDAQKQYYELEDDEDKDFYLFEFFKMELHKVTRLDATTTLKASNGKTMSALKVFSEALRYLKDHFLKSVADSNYGSITTRDIRWVITVPAIWSFKSKGFMREAALKAELITSETRNRLIIALEPESASIYCRNLEVKHFADMPPSDDKLKLAKGTRYIILDAGGGTLDVTVHEVEAEGIVKEIHFATGGAHGGMFVDRAFINLMKEVFGEEFIDNYKRDNPAQWMNIMIDFEQKKRACKPMVKTTTQLQLSYSFGTEYAAKAGGSIEKSCKGFKGVSISNGMIKIKNDIMLNLFKPIVEDNITHIEDLLKDKDMGGIKYLFMVGGFSNSDLLQSEVRENFGPSSRWGLKIMIPQEASVAVVKGAVAFGHDPLLIKERKSNMYYGIKVLADFDPTKHDKQYKRNIDGKDYIYEFNVLLNKGAKLGIEESKVYSPRLSDQSNAHLQIYTASAEPSPVAYIDDRILEDEDKRLNWCIGEVTAPWPGKGLDRRVTVYLSFGGTEIDVRAVCTPGDKITVGYVNALKS